jgi:gluconolactonase
MSAFKVHHESFNNILGPSPTLEVVLEKKEYPFAHEAGVFIASENSLFITSNQYPDPCSPSAKKIQISKVILSNDGTARCEEIFPENVPMANGGVNYKTGVLFCAQGNHKTPSGLTFMETTPPYRSSFLLASFYGRPFNSVNDIVVHSDGSVWFTDPIYGAEQGITPPPASPNQVYRWDVENGGGIRAVADGFGRCNGICFSPDEKIVYITDTDYIHGDGTTDGTRASSM